MNVPMYELASKIAIASRMIFSTHNGFSMSLSGSDDGYESGDEGFHFTISKDLLLDPTDIMLGEAIGEGGNSVVYRGLLKNGVLVAVKILQPSRSSRVSIRHKEKFQDEVLLLSKMKHDNIVKFVGACIEPHLVIVTEILEGGTLERFLWNSRPEPLDLKMSLSFALDISQAMEFMHSNGVVHRDLNPRNVLVTADQNHAKLIDFGLAKEEDTGGMTCEGGTYRWMAPEVCSPEPLRVGEKKHYDHKIDVYSFSLVFWMLLTNKTPFHRIPHRLSMCVPYFAYQGERPSLENLPDELASIIESCWAQDPNARPEFKQITVLLKKLLSRCVSDSNGGTILLEKEACDNDSENTYLIQECYCDGVKKPKEKKKKMKKVVNMFRPLVKMVKAFLSNSKP